MPSGARASRYRWSVARSAPQSRGLIGQIAPKRPPHPRRRFAFGSPRPPRVPAVARVLHVARLHLARAHSGRAPSQPPSRTLPSSRSIIRRGSHRLTGFARTRVNLLREAGALARVANVAASLRARNLSTHHFISVGGWNAPHPTASGGTVDEWYQALEAYQLKAQAALHCPVLLLLGCERRPADSSTGARGLRLPIRHSPGRLYFYPIIALVRIIVRPERSKTHFCISRGREHQKIKPSSESGAHSIQSRARR